jgi:hypothetical protein
LQADYKEIDCTENNVFVKNLFASLSAIDGNINMHKKEILNTGNWNLNFCLSNE